MNLKTATNLPVYEEIIKRINDRSAKVGVVGVGYVGQALVKGILEAGFQVFGFDLDSEKLKTIDHQNFFPKERVEGLAKCDIVCICVPTPLDESRKPDLRHLLQAVEDLITLKRPNQLVIIESTVAPGTLRREVLHCFQRSGRRVGNNLLLAISPERIDPGNKHFTVRNTPKIVGGIDEISTNLAAEFYESFVEKVVPMTSPEAAELTKMLENTFRLVNISLINQIKDYADRVGIDMWEVIEAASTKPYAFMPHYPGPGVGGHCIPVDPAYLLEEARQVGVELSLVYQALKVNEDQAKKIVELAKKKLNITSEASKKKMLLVGVSYKPNTDDTRESPALGVWQEAEKEGFEVSYYDPLVPEFNSRFSEEMTNELLNEQDIIIIITDHDNLPYETLQRSTTPLLDTRNSLKKAQFVLAEGLNLGYQ